MGQKVEIFNPGMGIKVQRSCPGDLSSCRRCCSAGWNKLDQPNPPIDDDVDDDDGDVDDDVDGDNDDDDDGDGDNDDE